MVGETGLDRLEELFDLVRVLHRVVAVGSGHSQHRAVAPCLNDEFLKELGLRDEDIRLLGGDKGSEGSRVLGVELIRRPPTAWARHLHVSHAEAHKLHQVLVLGCGTGELLAPAFLLECLEVVAGLLVKLGWQADLGLLLRPDFAEVAHVREDCPIGAGTVEEVVHAPSYDPGLKQELSRLWAE